MGGDEAGRASGQAGCLLRSRGFCPILGCTPPARASGSLAIGFCLDEADVTCKCPLYPQLPTPTRLSSGCAQPPPEDFPGRKRQQVEVQSLSPALSLVWPLDGSTSNLAGLLGPAVVRPLQEGESRSRAPWQERAAFQLAWASPASWLLRL